MNASVQTEDNRTLLLILPTAKQIFALNSIALTRAQASQRELADGYGDALLLDRDGSLRRIEQIAILGPWGDSFGRKLLSRLTGAWRVSVQLSQPLPWSIEELKMTLAECISASGGLHGSEPQEEQGKSELVAAILVSSSVLEIFNVLDLPPPDDALDVL